jgi:oxygen-independent coproporphyrinogen-3 oxidase
MKEAALYIHFPFCRQKCNYCDFYSITQLDHVGIYLNALKKEIELYQDNPLFGGLSFSTLFWGGGTPSLLSPTQLVDIIEHLQQGFSFTHSVEITCEVNPGTIDLAYLIALHEAGVNRLSIGVQSFIDEELKILTRIHSAQQAEQTVTMAQEAGFDNISVDLIFGIHGQSLKSWKYTLSKAVALKPNHISAYGLTIEAGTVLAQHIESGQVHRCNEELERQLYLLGKELLNDAGYLHYEISNYALPGYKCKHNRKYWDGSPYFGLGPSAHSFDGMKRWWNAGDVYLYSQKLERGESPVIEEEQLSREQELLEMILLGLRRSEGIDLKSWQRSAGVDLLEVTELLQPLGGIDTAVQPFSDSASGQFFVFTDHHLALTTQGLLLYDSLCQQLSALALNGKRFA